MYLLIFTSTDDIFQVYNNILYVHVLYVHVCMLNVH